MRVNQTKIFSSVLGTLVALLVLEPLVGAQGTLPLLRCETRDIPTLLPFPSAPVQFLHHSFYTLNDQRSEAVLDAKNLGESAVDGVAMVVEYNDEAGADRFQISYMAATQEQVHAFRSPLHAEYVRTLPEPLSTGKTAELAAISRLVGPSCPSKSEIVFLKVHYKRGGTQVWSLPGWRVGPVIEAIPGDVFMISAPHPLTPFSLILTASVSKRGDIVSLSSAQEGNEALITEITPVFRHLHFFPSLADGKPVSAELSVIVRFIGQERAAKEMSASDLSRRSVVVFAERDAAEIGKWYLVFAY